MPLPAQGDTDSFVNSDLSTSICVDGENSSKISGHGSINGECPVLEEKLPSATEKILESEDLLPIILLHLKENLIQDAPVAADSSPSALASPPKWKGPFRAFLLVNRLFLHAGSNMLWNTMEGLAPIFSLLPWYKPKYDGLGRFNYTSSAHWERFNFYAPRIHQLDLHSSPDKDIAISPVLLLELLTLQGRPDPFFPNLQSISISPHAYPGLHILFVLAGKSMHSLAVASRSEIVPTFATIPSDWEGNGAKGNGALAELLAVFPRISLAATHLQSFDYRGPISAEFLHYICLTKITSLKLTVTTASDASTLQKLQKLKSLQQLSIEAPLLGGVMEDTIVPQGWFFPRLEHLDVAAKGGQVPLLFQVLCPKRLVTVALKFIGKTKAFSVYLSLSIYLEHNSKLQNLSVSFVDGPRESQGGTRVRQETLAERKAMEDREYCIRDSESLQHLVFDNVPLHLTNPVLDLLKKSMRWSHRLKTVIFRAHDTKSNIQANANLPGLSLLEDLLWKEHFPSHNLEHLEFLFDGRQIVDEDLLDSNAFKRRQGSPAATLHSQCLRILKIQTLQANGRGLQLSTKRKVEIAMYLDRLFPRLEAVQGSARDGGVWEEIEVLVKSYQTVKEHVYAQVEAM